MVEELLVDSQGKDGSDNSNQIIKEPCQILIPDTKQALESKQQIEDDKQSDEEGKSENSEDIIRIVSDSADSIKQGDEIEVEVDQCSDDDEIEFKRVPNRNTVAPIKLNSLDIAG